MTPESVYARFCQEFPDVVPQITKWRSRRTDTAAGSIVVLLRNHRTLIFSVNKDGTWILKRN